MQVKDWYNLNKKFFLISDINYLLKCFLKKNFYENYFLSNQELLYLERIKLLYLKKIPLAYLLNKENFFGLDFEVNQSSFVPRNETEIILENIVNLIKKEEKIKNVLDLGCGLGNLAISLKKSIKEINVFATDINFPSLYLANKNAKRNKVKINFICADLLSCFKEKSFDLIISNPPYVEERFLKDFRYEPYISLWGGRDGLCFIKKIILSAKYFLRKNGFLILEIGYLQKEKLEKFLLNLNYEIKNWLCDYQNNYCGVILKLS